MRNLTIAARLLDGLAYLLRPFVLRLRSWFGPDPLEGTYWRLDGSGDVVLVMQVQEPSFSRMDPLGVRLFTQPLVKYRFDDGSEGVALTAKFKRTGGPTTRARYFPLQAPEVTP